MDEKVGDRVNVLNSARYRTRQKQARLHDLQMQYKQFADDDDGDGGAGRSSERGTSSTGGGKHGDTDAAKSADSKEYEEGQVMRLFYQQALSSLVYKYHLR